MATAEAFPLLRSVDALRHDAEASLASHAEAGGATPAEAALAAWRKAEATPLPERISRQGDVPREAPAARRRGVQVDTARLAPASLFGARTAAAVRDPLSAHPVAAETANRRMGAPSARGGDAAAAWVAAVGAYGATLTPAGAKEAARLLDPSWVLPMLTCALRLPDPPLRKVVEGGGLAFLIAATASAREETRRAAFEALALAFTALERAEGLRERLQLLALLRALKDALTRPYQRVPPLVAGFASAAVAVLRQPSHPMFSHVNQYLVRSPHLDLGDAPMVAQALRGAAHDASREVKAWTATVARYGAVSNADAAALSRRHVPQLLLAAAAAPTADDTLRRAALELALRCALTQRGAMLVGRNAGIVAWLTSLLRGKEGAGLPRDRVLLCAALLGVLCTQEQLAVRGEEEGGSVEAGADEGEEGAVVERERIPVAVESLHVAEDVVEVTRSRWPGPKDRADDPALAKSAAASMLDRTSAASAVLGAVRAVASPAADVAELLAAHARVTTGSFALAPLRSCFAPVTGAGEAPRFVDGIPPLAADSAALLLRRCADLLGGSAQSGQWAAGATLGFVLASAVENAPLAGSTAAADFLMPVDAALHACAASEAVWVDIISALARAVAGVEAAEGGAACGAAACRAGAWLAAHLARPGAESLARALAQPRGAGRLRSLSRSAAIAGKLRLAPALLACAAASACAQCGAAHDLATAAIAAATSGSGAVAGVIAAALSVARTKESDGGREARFAARLGHATASAAEAELQGSSRAEATLLPLCAALVSESALAVAAAGGAEVRVNWEALTQGATSLGQVVGAVQGDRAARELAAAAAAAAAVAEADAIPSPRGEGSGTKNGEVTTMAVSPRAGGAAPIARKRGRRHTELAGSEAAANPDAAEASVSKWKKRRKAHGTTSELDEETRKQGKKIRVQTSA